MKLKLYMTKEEHASECLFGVGHCRGSRHGPYTEGIYNVVGTSEMW